MLRLNCNAFCQIAILCLAGEAGLSAGEVAPPTPAERKAEEQKLIAVLTGGTQPFDKDVACRRLAVIGSKDAVPALAAMLSDPNLCDIARYGLENIPDPAVDEALRAALAKVQGKNLVSVIRSVGTRRDAQAVEALVKILNGTDTDAASAAGVALGKIGDSAAAKALEQALASAPPAVRAGVGEGCLTITDALLAQGKRDEAAALADRVRATAAMPNPVRSGAFRAAVLGRGAAGVPLIIEQLKGEEKELIRCALVVARQLPGADASKALASELDKLPTDRRVLLIQALGDRRDPAALPAILAEVKNGEKVIRAAALRVLGQLSDASVVPILLKEALDSTDEAGQSAKATLSGLRGKDVDAAILDAIAKSDPRTQKLAIEIAGERRIAAAAPTLIRFSADAEANRDVRLAAIKVLSDISGPAAAAALFKAAAGSDKEARAAAIKGLGAAAGAEDLDQLIALLVKTKDAQELQTAETALGALIARIPEKQACAEKLLAPLAEAAAPVKCVLLRRMSATPVPKALAAIRAAAQDANNEVKDSAIHALCEWPLPEAAPELLELAKSSANPTYKILALRGYMRLSGDKDIPADKKLAMCKEAAALAQRDDDKKQLLAALATVPLLEALRMVVPELDGKAKAEAAAAAVSIGEQIVKAHPTEAAEAMKKVLEATKSRDLVRRANSVLGQAGQKAAKKK